MRRLRALLWKEWRQMAPLFVACAVGCVVFLGLGRIADAIHAKSHDDIVTLMTFLFCGFVLLLFPSTIIAGERRTGGLAFLRELPVPRGKLLFGKLTVAAAMCAALLLFGALMRGALNGVAPFPWPGADKLAVGAAYACLVICSCFFASSVVRHPLVAFLAGPAVALLLVYLFDVLLPYRLVLVRFPGWRSNAAALALLAFPCIWLLLWARRRIFRWSPSAWSAGWGVAKPVLLLVGVLLLMHGTFFLLISLCTSPSLDQPYNVWGLVPSPDGRSVALQCYSTEGMRVGLMNADTGRARFLTRFNSSELGWRWGDYGASAWSPDGRRLVLDVINDWWFSNALWQFGVTPPARRFIYELPATGGARRGEMVALPRSYGTWWASSSELLCWTRDEKDGAFQLLKYDAVRRSATRVPLPASDARPAGHWSMEGPLTLVRERTLYVYRAATSDWVQYAAPQNSTVLAVSREGRLLVFSGPSDKSLQPRSEDTAGYYLLENVTGDISLVHLPQGSTVTLELNVHVSPSDAPGQRIFWHGQFSPDGRHLLYRILDKRRKAQDVRICDLETGLVEKVGAPSSADCRELRFSPRGDRATWYHLRAEKGEPVQWVLDIESRTAKPIIFSPAGNCISRPVWLGEDHLVFITYSGTSGRGAMVVRLRWDGTEGDELFPVLRKLTERLATVTGRPRSEQSQPDKVRP